MNTDTEPPSPVLPRRVPPKAVPPLRLLVIGGGTRVPAVLDDLLAATGETGGAEVVQVATVAEGLSLFDRLRHDAVLLHADLGETALAGATDTLLRLQASAVVIVLTDGPADAAEGALERGALDVLHLGSFDPAGLHRMIRWLRGHRAVASTTDQRLRTMTSQLLDSMPGAFLLLDASWRLRRTNAAVRHALGWSASELADRPLAELLHPGDTDRLARTLAESAEHGMISLELSIARKSGGFVPFFLSGAPFWHEGEACLLVTGLDLSERRAMESQLAHTQKMESIGRLAGGVAHDFNNMLAAVLSFSEVVLMDSADDDPRRADVETIRDSALRAAGLTRQLLAFSRRQEFQPRVTDVNKLVSGIDRMLRRLIGADVELVTLLDESARAVMLDPGQMESALVNMVVNARDAMPDGGTLTIETSNVVLPPRAGASGPVAALVGPAVRVTITDTGTGMSADVLERIFEPFFTTKDADRGTGLGMALVYGIVTQSAGEISVRSEPGKGTRFTIDFAAATGTEEAAATSVGPAPGGAETVLVAEDNDTLRRGVTAILSARGYRVLAASGGAEALRLAEAHQGSIDLVLADMVMPKMGAKELHDRLRAARPEARIVFMSGYMDRSAAREELAADHFLQKPFLADDLLRALRSVLDQPRAAAA